MAEFNQPSQPSAPPVRTSVKVIVLVLGIVGGLTTCCGLAIGALYALIPASSVPVGTEVGQMRLGGFIISSLVIAPGIIFLVIALALWFFLWRKK